MIPVVFATIFVLGAMAWFMGRSRSLEAAGGDPSALHSLPAHYGHFATIWVALPALGVTLLWAASAPQILDWLVLSGLPEGARDLPERELERLLRDARGLATGNLFGAAPTPEMSAIAERYAALQGIADLSLLALVFAASAAGFGYARSRIGTALRARNRVERVVLALLIACSTIAILTTVGIVFSLVFEALRFFSLVSPFEFLFGLEWSPQTALRADQVGSSGAFGAVPIFLGTAVITAIAMTVAVPVGLMSAIYLADYASERVRSVGKPMLEILAGIPTVVYGFFAALTVAPLIRGWGESLGLDVASESALAAGLIMGVMIVPFVSSLSDDVISAVPQALREGSLGLGATQSETIRQVVLPAALPGIVGAVLLAISRAVGETMIVVMAAGLAANLTVNPLEAVTTVTVQIVTLLTGDQEFDSAKTLAAFALGLVLFFITLVLNVIALRVVRRYREQYE